jgi:multicomponent K+:H+ antiporter subunit F
MLVLYGLQLGVGRYYEAALLIAMLGFLTTVVLSKFLTRGDVIE